MKLFVFDMDGTLLKGRTILYLAKNLGFYHEALEIIEGPTTRDRSSQLAMFLKGEKIDDILEIARGIPLMKGAIETVEAIRDAGHRTAIVTDSYDVVAEHFRERLEMDRAVGLELISQGGAATGEILMPATCPTREECGYPSICKGRVLRELAGEFGIPLQDTIAVGDNRVDICMMKAAGLGIAFDPKVAELEEAADIVIKEGDLQLILRNINIK